jgi:hypothetical protein
MIKRAKVIATTSPQTVIGSLCECGHVGDAEEPISQHAGMSGHGRCRIRGCKCEQFTWAGFLGVVK